MIADLLAFAGVAATSAGWVHSAGRAVGLQHRLRTDALTGLANREALAEQVRRVSRRAGAVGLLLAGLDDFKPVNDIHGHDAGNQLLRHVAQRLTSVAHHGELVARLHGDEFAILLGALPSGPAGHRAAALRADQFAGAVASPMACQLGALAVTASIGAAVLPLQAASLSALLTAADDAMYRLKAARHRRPTPQTATAHGAA
ncbi:MAG: GGDEF domain-containing protein [Sciscionella sp.]